MQSVAGVVEFGWRRCIYLDEHDCRVADRAVVPVAQLLQQR